MPPFIRKRRGWDWFSPREIHHLPYEQRTQLIHDARQAAQSHWTFRVVNATVPLFVTSFYVVMILHHHFDGQVAYALSVFYVTGIVGSMIGSFWYQHRLLKRVVRQLVELQGIAPAVCFDCGYDVEGFTGAECPVCGTVLVPHPAPPPPDPPHLASGASDGPGPVN